MTFKQQWAVALDTNFLGRVAMAAIGIATAAVGEDGAGKGKIELAKRHALGTRILQGDRQLVNAIVRAVAAQVGDVDGQATVTDGAISAALVIALPDIAGITAADKAS